MTPWEQDEEEFVDDIGVRDIKVVLECRNIDVAVELYIVS